MVADKTTIIQRLKYTLYTINTISKSHTSIKDIYYVFKAPAWKNMKQFKIEGQQPDLYNN